jgi:hypothetical protein
MRERCLGCGLDAMSGSEVVHSKSLVTLRPQRERVFPAVEEVGRSRPHVGAGQKGVAVRLQPPLVRGQYCGPVAACETDARLGARVGHAAGRELLRHCARETGDFLDIDVGQHPSAARRDREQIVVDDHEGLEAGTDVAKLDNAHRSEPTFCARTAPLQAAQTGSRCVVLIPGRNQRRIARSRPMSSMNALMSGSVEMKEWATSPMSVGLWDRDCTKVARPIVVVSETTIPRQIRGLNAHCVDERRLFRADIATPGGAARLGKPLAHSLGLSCRLRLDHPL